MTTFQTAQIMEILLTRRGLQRMLTTRGSAYALTDIVGLSEIGDEVVLNTTAVELELGTGGQHVVHWNLSQRGRDVPVGTGHIMKARYLSEQNNVTAVEEDLSLQSSRLVKRIPVVICSLHSQMPVSIIAAKASDPSLRIGLVMNDSAALPYALSDTCAQLEENDLLDETVTIGNAFGAEHEAVTLYGALQFLESRVDIVIVAPGIGVVGTGSAYGFSSMSNASECDIVDKMGGEPILVVRASQADPRPRHQGVSHHVSAILEMSHSQPWLAIPSGCGSLVSIDPSLARIAPVVSQDVASLLEKSGIRVTTMGRSYEADALFFDFAAAAGTLAAELAGRTLS